MEGPAAKEEPRAAMCIFCFCFGTGGVGGLERVSFLNYWLVYLVLSKYGLGGPNFKLENVTGC